MLNYSLNEAELIDFVNHHEVNALYYDPIKKKYLTPLSYSIVYHFKEMFDNVLPKSDINFCPEKMEKHALGYALEQSDLYYLRQLLKTKQLDHSVKNKQNINYIEYLMSIKGRPSGLILKFVWRNIAHYLKRIEKQGIDFPSLVSEQGVLAGKLLYGGLVQDIIHILPEKWLIDQLKRNVDHMGLQAPVYYPMLTYFRSVPKELKKIIQLVGFDKDEQGNNLFHIFALKKDPVLTKSIRSLREYEVEKMLHIFLELGFDLNQKNDLGETAHQGMMDYEFYSTQVRTNMFNTLTQNLNEPTINKKKRKI